MEVNYDILGHLNVKINGDKYRTPISHIDTEYAQFHTENNGQPDVLIKLGEFDPDFKGKTLLDNSYVVGEDYLFVSDSYEYASWEAEVSGFQSDKLIIRLHTNRFGHPFITGMVIDPFIYYKLNAEGYPVIHASGVSDQDSGYAFVGPSGCGKTTHAIELLNNDLKILSDDALVLSEGSIHGIPYPLNVFQYNLSQSIADVMNKKDLLVYHIKQILKFITGHGIATKIPITRFSSYSEKSKSLEKIFLLERGEEYRLQQLSKEKLIKRLVRIQQLDNIFLYKYIKEYSYENPRSPLAEHWNIYAKNLRKEIENVEIYSVEVPIHSRKRFEKVRENI